MKNKKLTGFSKFHRSKFFLAGAVIVLCVLAAYFNYHQVAAQIAGKIKVEDSFFAPEFVQNSGSLDTSFAAGLLSDFESGNGINAVLKQPDGRILVAGSFNNVGGVSRRVLARLNPDLSVDPTFSVITGGYTITTLALQSDGKILVGGTFSDFNGNSNLNGIVRLNPNGSVDESFDVSFQHGYSSVSKIFPMPNGKILITGSFSNIGDVLFPGIALLESDGNVDPLFNPGTIANGGSQASIGTAAIQPDGKILIAGFFNSVNGYARNRLARLNGNGQLDLSFDPGYGPNGQIYSLAQTPDGKILIGGDFTAVNGILRSRIARLNADGSVDSSFNFVPLGEFTTRALVLQPNEKIIAGGDLSGFNQVNNSRVVFRLNKDGSHDSTFDSPVGTGNSGITGGVTNLILENDGKVIIGGSFNSVSNTVRRGLARLNSNGNLDASFKVLFGSNGTVSVVAAQPDGKVLISGNFSYINGIARNRLARLNRDGSVDENFDVTFTQGTYGGSSTYITAIAVQPDGKILLGGNIASINGTNVNGIGRLNSDGSLDTSFQFGQAGSVTTITIQPDGKIILSGSFYGGSTVQYLLRVNADGTLDNTFNAGNGPNGGVLKTALQSDGKLIITGSFTSYNNVEKRGIARVNANGSLDLSFNADLGSNGNAVNAIAVQSNGKILLGGNFFQVNGVNRSRLARLNADGSLDTSFSTIFQEGIVYAVAVQPDGKIIAAGSFNNVFGAVRRKVVRLFPDGSVDTIFNPNAGPDSDVVSLVRQTDGKILLGGNFAVVDGVSRTGIARMRTNACVASPLYDFDGDGKTDISYYQPNGGAWFRLNTTNNSYYQQLFGLPTDLITPGDYDGDEKTDIAVFRPAEGTWYLLNSRTGFRTVRFGSSEDKPLAADFDGDGVDDFALFRPSTGSWYILRSRLGFTGVQFGAATDIPVIADMDGDCQADITVFRPSNGAWYWLQSSSGDFRAIQFGISGDVPVAGDYDGDGKTDIAVYRPSNGTWFYLKSLEGFSAQLFGTSTDKPVAADYDGDGKTDTAVYRNGTWYILRTLDAKIQGVQFGEANDLPIPAAFQPR